MSAYTHDEYKKIDIPNTDKPMKCYFCGENLSGTEDDIGGLVYWHGNGNAIALHQSCSLLFSINLIQDARSLVSMTGEEIKFYKGKKKDRKETWYYKNA